MIQHGILVAGIGNIFMGDDAFGSEVARQLAAREWPSEVRVVDFGIRGFDLAYALLDGYETTILIDATPRGGDPGTLYVIEPDLSDLDTLDAPGMMVETHGMNPMRVLAMVKSMGGAFQRILLVGCEPRPLESEEDGAMGLSLPVQEAVPRAIELIGSLVAQTLSEVTAQSLSVGI
jgi:hydrogenase maturation protease